MKNKEKNRKILALMFAISNLFEINENEILDEETINKINNTFYSKLQIGSSLNNPKLLVKKNKIQFFPDDKIPHDLYVVNINHKFKIKGYSKFKIEKIIGNMNVFNKKLYFIPYVNNDTTIIK